VSRFRAARPASSCVGLRRIQERTVEAFIDVFNLTNRTNFDNPTVAAADQRTPSTFLVLTNLRGGSGFPRQVQFGFRLAF
jgi:hypothetical protein